MNRIFLLIFFIFHILRAFSNPILVTSTCFGGSGNDLLLDVAYAPDGTLVVAGYTSSTDWNFPLGTLTYVLGTDGAESATIFVARFSNDAKQLLSYTRFPYESVKYDLLTVTQQVHLAVSDSGIYVVSCGRATLKNIPGFHGKLDNVAGNKPFIVRLSLDVSHVLNGTYLGGSDGDREVNDVDLFPNGDICVNSDLGGAVWNGKVSRLKPDLSAYVWSKTFPVWCGEARLNAVAVTPDGQYVYVGGYGMGATQFEPYKDPFLFMFDGNDGTQLWKRGTDSKDYGVFNFRQDSIGLNRLISDSQVNGLGVDKNGNALVTAYSDGGASVFNKEPWWGGYYRNEGTSLPTSIEDGDSFAGFVGVTSASTVGRMDKNGNWIRAHRIKPPRIWNEIHGICASSDDKVFLVGGGPGIPEIGNWNTEVGGWGVLMKMDLDSTGGNRRFVTHFVGVDELYKIARDRTTYRYAAVGKAISQNGLVDTKNAIQSKYGGGGRDGYLLVFDDNEKTSSTSFEINTTADANVKFGTKTNTNYGSAVIVEAKRRDSRPDETSKAYFKFDLSGVTEPILRAKFQVYKPEKYSAGFLTVYALKEGAETWAENTITWNNAPGNLIASPSYMDMTKVDSLGRWEIKNAIIPQIETFETTTFSQYIENARLIGDKSVTLVLTSYSPVEQDKPALQSSSKENTTTPIQPHLQIEVAPKASVLTEILFYPNTLTLKIGESKKMEAIAVDQYGAQLPATVIWSVDNGGDLSDSGVFTATKDGNFKVKASVGGVSTQMTVTVTNTNAVIKTVENDNPTIAVHNKNMQVLWQNHTDFNISIMNLVGQVQLNDVANSNHFAAQLKLKNGIYLVRLSKGNHNVVRKILLN
jgi:hypothetical protein